MPVSNDAFDIVINKADICQFFYHPFLPLFLVISRAACLKQPCDAQYFTFLTHLTCSWLLEMFEEGTTCPSESTGICFERLESALHCLTQEPALTGIQDWDLAPQQGKGLMLSFSTCFLQSFLSAAFCVLQKNPTWRNQTAIGLM